MKKWLIYLLGVLVLGLTYEYLKHSIGSPIFAAVAVSYLIILRLGAEKFGQ